MAAGFLYGYFSFLLGPLSSSEKAALAEAKRLEPLIAAARSQIKRTNTIEAADSNAAAAAGIWAIMGQKIPKGATIAWVPQKFSDFFKRQNIQRVGFKLNSEPLEPNIAGYKSTIWALEIPRIGFVSLGNSLKALENEDGFLQVHAVTIDSMPSDLEFQRVQLTVSTLAYAK